MQMQSLGTTSGKCVLFLKHNTVEHDFNGREVNRINGVNGKKCYDRAFHLVNKLHDFTGIHDLVLVALTDKFNALFRHGNFPVG